MQRTVEKRAWKNMQLRCYDPKNVSYKNYGGRGIAVCNEWCQSFEAFFEHVGPRPSPEHTLDRIKNDGNYEPGNVQWATPKQQAANRRGISNSSNIVLSPTRCRMARAAVGWGVRDLANKSGVTANTIVRFEGGVKSVSLPTQKLVRQSFRDAGVKFMKNGGVIPPRKNGD